jgi:uncharacterized protein
VEEAAMEELTDTVLKTFDSGEIHVDSEGDWFYQGNRITREDILEFFLDHLVASDNNSYEIVWKNQRCPVVVDDTPFVIARVDRQSGDEQTGERFILSLSHLSGNEVLNPATLRVGKNNVMYANVRSNRHLARFSRPAYYQLAAYIQEDVESGQFYLEINGERHAIDFSHHDNEC